MLFKLFIVPLLIHNALAVTVPIPGRPVYIESTNSIWSFSLSRASQAGNILNKIDLDQSFNTLSPAV
jgi:hypothetical protein